MRRAQKEFFKAKGSTAQARDAALRVALDHERRVDAAAKAVLDREKIPLPGRIMAIADVYDALISKRRYKLAFSHEKAVGIITEGQNKHFDPAMVDAFLVCAEEFREIASRFRDD
jgi:response regulator RpfG family c-di-GMP phosphodiesterase